MCVGPVEDVDFLDLEDILDYHSCALKITPDESRVFLLREDTLLGALARPLYLFHYGDACDMADLAACTGYAIVEKSVLPGWQQADGVHGHPRLSEPEWLCADVLR